MKVFKFGGASVRDAAAVRNVERILELYSGEKLVVVISAMGKTTNLLEEIHNGRFQKIGYEYSLKKMKDYDWEIADELFGDDALAKELLNEKFNEFQNMLGKPCSNEFDKEYDQVVSYGEIISTALVNAYLLSKGFAWTWIDAREIIKTDNCYRTARILWNESSDLTQKKVAQLEESDILIIQGFIGSTKDGFTTTLGREGSDFTASIMAYLLDAESVTIWKDVPGMLNADPK